MKLSSSLEGTDPVHSTSLQHGTAGRIAETKSHRFIGHLLIPPKYLAQ